MGQTTITKGKKGEEAAVEFLQNLGYEIICRNYRFEHGEIDIIAWDGEVLVFVEVKLRRSRRFGVPEDSVTARKQQHIKRAAEGFLYERGIQDVECRFDVVAIDEAYRPKNIRHYINAFP
ncbi:MAG: YraN family protein [Bacteroidota bacterium]